MTDRPTPHHFLRAAHSRKRRQCTAVHLPSSSRVARPACTTLPRRRRLGDSAATHQTHRRSIPSHPIPYALLPMLPLHGRRLARTAAAAADPPGAPPEQPAAPPPPPPGVLITYYADHWVVPLPPDHRFPMLKYAATHAALEADASLQDAVQLRPAPQAALGDVTLVHDERYVERFRSNAMTEAEMRNVGFPWSTQLVGRTFASTGGTVAAMRAVLGEGRAMAANIAGGTHHAFRDRGEGFCVFNDIAVAAAVALRDFGVERVLVVDLDVHQGNGTAAIFEDDPRVTTFDMHGDKNYPWKTRMRNTYDIALPDGTTDEPYLEQLGAWLPRLMEQHTPQLMFFQAGVDALEGDSFGRLSLSRGGLARRNNMVYSTALAGGVPLVISMGGGYTRPMDRSVEAHTDVYRTAAYRLSAWAKHQQQLQQQARPTPMAP